MKCNRVVFYGWKSHIHSSKSKPKIILSTENPKEVNPLVYGAWDIDRIQPCEGEIESRIVLENILYYGGADPNIEVRFRCKNCGAEFAGNNGLPYDVDSLNKFLTEVLKNVP